jgi:UDP-N-acetylmuramoylalanine-D-glutamate ligase
VRASTSTGISRIGLPGSRHNTWLGQILSVILRENKREGVALLPAGEVCDLAIDMDGHGLPHHSGKLVRRSPDVDTGIPDPNQWHFSPDAIVWRGASVRHGLLVAVQAGRAFVLTPVRELALPEGMIDFVLAAVATSQALGIEPQGIRRGLDAWRKGFERLKLAGERQGVQIWDDSRCDSDIELMQALQTFERKVTLVTGGSDFQSSIDPELLRHFANRVFLLPGTPANLVRSWTLALQATLASDLREAVQLGLDRTSAGGAVLIAPACSSGQELSHLVMEAIG